MFNLLRQLLIEGFLSKGVPYIASHPELGVPIGIFNTKDEPNYQARVKSIKKYGVKGNPLSNKLAKLLGIQTPIPSYQDNPEGPKALSDKQMKQLNEYNKVTSNILGNQTEIDRLLGSSFKRYERLLKPASTANELLNIALNGLDAEHKIRQQLIGTMGVMGSLQKAYQQEIQQAVTGVIKYGGTMEDVMGTIRDLSSEMGRNLLMDNESIERMVVFGKSVDIASGDVAKLAAGFERMGLGIQDGIDMGNEMAQVARKMGLNVSQFMSSVAGNMKMVNAYNFKDGVAGFTRMAAQAQRLQFDMNKVLSTVEKVWDPEGAIQMAADLQVMGGAVGALSDPFQTMYMATSNMEGLQDSILQTAASMIHLDEATGELTISPTEMRRMREFANATGQDYQELVNSARLLKKEQAVMQQMGSLFGGEEDQEMLQQFVAAQAQFKDGEYVVEIEGKDIAVDELGEKQLQLLRSQQKDSAKDEKDIALDQLHALDAIKLSLDEGLKVMEFDAADTFAPLIKDVGDAGAEIVRGIGSDVYEEIKVIGKAAISDMLGEGDGTNLTIAITELSKKITDMFEVSKDSGVDFNLSGDKTNIVGPTAITDIDQWWASGLDVLKAQLIGESNNVNDYFTSGKVNILQDGKPSVTTAEQDLVMVIDRNKVEGGIGPQQQTMPDMTSLERSTSQNQITQLGNIDGKFNITVDGTSHIIVDGRNLKIPLRDMFNDDELISFVKDKLDKKSLYSMGGNDNERGKFSIKQV